MQSPELVLNPETLLSTANQHGSADNNKISRPSNNNDCWICYDPDKNDALIQPCDCTGDTSIVHHECLKRWLLQNSVGNQIPQCGVCKKQYRIRKTGKLKWKTAFGLHHWFIVAVTASMCLTVIACWTVMYLCSNSYVRIISATVALLVTYTCFRLLGQNLLRVYRRAKFAALKIDSQAIGIADNNSIPP